MFVLTWCEHHMYVRIAVRKEVQRETRSGGAKFYKGASATEQSLSQGRG